METTRAIVTQLGEISGRNAIYLDKFLHDEAGLRLEGEINGSLCQVTEKKNLWLAYRLSFAGALAYDCRELEICRWSYFSSFDEVEESAWLRELGLEARCRHYVVATYDFVYRIAATGFELEIVGERTRGRKK
jgi:hypothetical protein